MVRVFKWYAWIMIIESEFTMSRIWEADYIEWLNDQSISYHELGKRIEQYRPSKIYKFMRFDDYWKKNLFEGQIFFSPSNILNDPFDCLIYINREKYGEYVLEEMQRLFPRIDKKVLKEETTKCLKEDLKDIVSSLRKEIRVTCFTENFLSPLMWSHYADKHQGFCIEYDLSRIAEGYRRCILPIIYSNTKCDVTDAIISKNTNLLMNPFYYKSKDWEYEKEWRMVIFENMIKDGEYFADFSQVITGIYLGLGSLKKHRVEISEILEKYLNTDTTVYEMYLDEYTYDLKYRKFQ